MFTLIIRTETKTLVDTNITGYYRESTQQATKDVKETGINIVDMTEDEPPTAAIAIDTGKDLRTYIISDYTQGTLKDNLGNTIDII